MKFEVGQTLWRCARHAYSNAGYVTIKTIGRKWITLADGRRITKEEIDTPRAYYYTDKSIYENYQTNLKLWGKFIRKITYLHSSQRPTTDQIRKAAEILGMSLDEEEGKNP